MQELNKVALWVSHIVIAHRDSNAAATSLRAPGWHPDGPWPDRTKAQALLLALEVAESAARSPERFEELAKKYSDDVVTRDRGGSLGGVRAGQIPSEFIDALATLRPGEISRVIETSFGYHLVKRGPVPAAMQVAGKRLVIRYVGTYGGRGGEVNERSREQARALALDVARAAVQPDASFDELVARYSENADRDEGGDIGVFASNDPAFMPAEVERLSQLQIGEVSLPMDSASGFEILRRTEAISRPRFAMADIAVGFDPGASAEDPHSRSAVLAEARRLAERVARRPAEFDSIRMSTCCAEPDAWFEGRGQPGVAGVVQHLPLGAIAPDPVESGTFFLIVKRIDATAIPEPAPPRYEVPAPAGPDFDALVRYTRADVLARGARALAAEAGGALGLRGDRASELPQILNRLATSFEVPDGSAEDRLHAWHGALDEVRRLLGSTDFGRFQDFLDTWATKQIVVLPKW